MVDKTWNHTKMIVIAVIIFIAISAILFLSTSSTGKAILVNEEDKSEVIEKISFTEERLVLKQRNLILERNQEDSFLIGTYNDLNEELVYSIDVEIVQKEQSGGKSFSDDLKFVYHPGTFFLDQSQGGINLIKVKGKELHVLACRYHY